MTEQHEPSPVTFVSTQGVKEYRATIPYCVGQDDTVLEVGVEWGTTTAILARYAVFTVTPWAALRLTANNRAERGRSDD